jgi:hypothetical protein
MLDGIHPSGWVRVKAAAFSPRDGHLARHRPVAGVLLGERLSGHDLFFENTSKIVP